MPSGMYLFGSILFSLIGFAAFRYGKRLGEFATMGIGVVLMVYPYAVGETCCSTCLAYCCAVRCIGFAAAKMQL